MKSDKPKNSHIGSKFTVTHCKGALDSYIEALSHVDARKHKTFTNAVVLQIARLADGHRMSIKSFPQEGELPKRKGQKKAKRFNALKKIPIRGYCWLSDKHKDTYFISHYVYKNYDKLKERDTNQVGANWRRIEENDDEC